MIPRDRTIWCTTEECPASLLLPDGSAIREIFYGFADPVSVQHKQRSLNTKSPSLVRPDLERQAAAADAEARRALDLAARSSTAPSTQAAAPGSGPTAPAPPSGEVCIDLLKPEPTASLLECCHAPCLLL
uniref:Uncharacterized protein n=1 Tax=Peronospora matthiolae TaxID=2874970 RepID=A0AAV1T695_9STRA